MDRIDWKILQALERQGRISYADLAESVGVSKSPCWARVRQREEDGVIEGYTVRLDPAALGLHVQSFVRVMIRLGAHRDFEEAVMAHPAVIECHTTAGSGDYLLRIYARSVGHFDDLLRYELSKLPGVDRLDSTICLKTIKQHGPLATWAASLANVTDRAKADM
ncbi:Lrp/AsnC family transcriptional regulator [Sphingobium sp. HBC34]|uniref:Lrp/AsnC family transcriptional regulator n=1 Tax=Sphingobium cyanobacteriorum TaxID=3063954 RepID=A0ABT8ZL58_9SPHN|nr:Lrp/AsnC family transcriptional regulator [Sphingobium sp. HBC34]MDO7835272.1 Lrp/AsnC family transcriptional regulator [Sphingobium sp. HBC34]